MANSQRAPTIWFDVQDLLRYLNEHSRPSGIQRLSFEVYRAFANWADCPLRVGFVRSSAEHGRFVVQDWHHLERLFNAATAPKARGRFAFAASSAAEPSSPEVSREGLHRVLGRYRRPATRLVAMQLQAVSALGTVMVKVGIAARRAGLARATRRREAAPARRLDGGAMRPGETRETTLAKVARRGDILAILGSPWVQEDYAAYVAHARSRLGLRTAVLVHDMIPVKRPEWCSRETTRVFRNWYSSVLPLTDIVLTNSRCTAADTADWCQRTGIPLAAPPIVVPIGSGFGVPDATSAKARISSPVQAGHGRVPADVLAQHGLTKPYVLFVSTIEVRKNHLLLFRVWRNLIERPPRDGVPELVLAGKEGWLVRDFMQQVESSRALDGKLRLIGNASDAEIAALYEGCLFTVFPSHYEGWGLPVTEALAAGKPCIASNSSAIPEAGGRFARYFDPGDLEGAERLIRATLESPEELRTWTEEIRRDFQPVPWTRTAKSIAEAFVAMQDQNPRRRT